MQVAEDLVKQGMTSSGAFNEALEAFVANHRLKNIIETGTYLG